MVLNSSDSSMGESRKTGNGGGAPNWTGNRGISADGGKKFRKFSFYQYNLLCLRFYNTPF